MILEMLPVVDRQSIGLISGKGTRYMAATLEPIDIIRHMLPECVLLAEDPRAAFEVEAFIPNAEETL